MGKKKVTLSLDEKVYKQFQNFCEENDIMLSKRIERLIKNHLALKNEIKYEKHKHIYHKRKLKK
jgi:hypothetical protein